MTENPVPFSPEFERPVPDEAAVDRGLTEAMLAISRTTLKDTGHAWRSVHAKSHGVLRGRLQVLPGLPGPLAQGVYASPGDYPVLMRFSTTPGDVLDDNVSTPRGLAIKIVGVEGERLPGSEGARTQDYVLGNSPAFNVADAATFLTNVHVLGATADRAETLKKGVSAVMRTAEAALEMLGGQSATLTTFAGQARTHILGDSFYSQAALLHGRYFGKTCIAPVSPELVALNERKLDLAGKPDGIREAVRDFFRSQGGAWELRVQLCTDIEAMPVEDASVIWPEDRSPYVAVARITVAPQDSWSSEGRAGIEDGAAFSPWQGLAAHRPLGSIMRARRRAYASSRQFRERYNGFDIAEPAASA